MTTFVGEAGDTIEVVEDPTYSTENNKRSRAPDSSSDTEDADETPLSKRQFRLPKAVQPREKEQIKEVERKVMQSAAATYDAAVETMDAELKKFLQSENLLLMFKRLAKTVGDLNDAMKDSPDDRAQRLPRVLGVLA